jgi:hypothetical protein
MRRKCNACSHQLQAYVALSRATSLEGLCVQSIDESCIRADPAVLDFYRKHSLL